MDSELVVLKLLTSQYRRMRFHYVINFRSVIKTM
jgi:hypothetical protein